MMLKTNKLKLERIPIWKIKTSNFNIRAKIEPDQNLKRNLYEKGQINPLITLNDYTLISGYRRYAELKRLRARKVWILKVSYLKKSNVLEYQLSEILHSKDINPMDKGRAFKRLMDLKKLSVQKLSKILNIPKHTLEWHLKLLKLPKAIKSDISEGRLKPYGIRMHRLYGKKRIRTRSDFILSSNDILFDSFLKRIAAMRTLIPQIEYTENQSKEAKILIKELLTIIEKNGGANHV